MNRGACRARMSYPRPVVPKRIIIACFVLYYTRFTVQFNVDLPIDKYDPVVI